MISKSELKRLAIQQSVYELALDLDDDEGGDDMTVAELISALKAFPNQEAAVLGCDYPIGGVDKKLSHKDHCVLILRLP